MTDPALQIEKIRQKLALLREQDQQRAVFGADQHGYALNPPLLEYDVALFEEYCQVTLPEGYRQFLTQLGNGGAGPFYGLVPLHHAIREDLNNLRSSPILNPGLPFPYREAWHPTEEAEDRNRLHHLNGLLRIASYGCGISINLVVNGEQYGYLWTDDRCNDGGLSPSQELGNSDRITFLDWYELWLDQHLQEMEQAAKPTKPKWQFWKAPFFK